MFLVIPWAEDNSDLLSFFLSLSTPLRGQEESDRGPREKCSPYLAVVGSSGENPMKAGWADGHNEVSASMEFSRPRCSRARSL